MKRIHTAIVAVATALLISLIVQAQPITNGGGLRLVTHGSGMFGSGTTANPLDLRHDCSSGSGLSWNGAGWVCAAMGGVTNSAGNNIVTKSNGTNLVASSITDDGTTVSTTDVLKVNELVDGVTVDNTGFNTGGLVNNYAFPAGKRTVVINTNASGVQVTGIAAPAENYRRITIVNNGTNCIQFFDDNTNSTITNRLKLEVAATGAAFVCPRGTLECLYDPNLGSVTPGRYQCSITFAGDTPGDMTVDGNLNISGNISAVTNITSSGTQQFTDVFINGLAIVLDTVTNATSTTIVNATGFAGGTTQFRNVTFDDGKGNDLFLVTGSLGVVGTKTNIPFIVGQHLRSGDTSTLAAGDLSACGTTPSITTGYTATDLAGSITEGTTATGCTITFKHTYTVPPSCVCSGETSGAAAFLVGCKSTATTLVVVNASATGAVVNYACVGY